MYKKFSILIFVFCFRFKNTLEYLYTIDGKAIFLFIRAQRNYCHLENVISKIFKVCSNAKEGAESNGKLPHLLNS